MGISSHYKSMKGIVFKFSLAALVFAVSQGAFVESSYSNDGLKPLQRVQEPKFTGSGDATDSGGFAGHGKSSANRTEGSHRTSVRGGSGSSFSNFIKSVQKKIRKTKTFLESYKNGRDTGFQWGQMHQAQGYPPRHRPFIHPGMHGGPGFNRGMMDGYRNAFQDYDRSSYEESEVSSEVLEEFLSAIEENEKLQEVLEAMEDVEHNDRCAEGVIEILSALMGEDIRKYADWDDLEFTAEGYPCITTDVLDEMLENSDMFTEVDPNSSSDSFRINVIIYPTVGAGHIEIIAPDGTVYSDGVHEEGSALNDAIPKCVTSYDVDIEKFLGYEDVNSSVNTSYTEPFATFFATDPNEAARNTLFD